MPDTQLTHQSSTSDFLDYSLFSTSLNSFPSKRTLLVNTINQYSYCIADKDPGFKTALQGSDILLPDGIAVVAATRFLTGQKTEKIAGADMHEHLLRKLNNTGGSCFYLGASKSTLQKIKQKLSIELPNIRVGSYSPPYKTEFSKEDNQKMTAAVNAFAADVLFIGMTAPKQEKWAYEHKDLVNSKIICTIGAVFDFYAGTVERPGQFWISCGLEWFIRLVNEPMRLWKRYLYYGPIFAFLMVKEKARMIRSKRDFNVFER